MQHWRQHHRSHGLFLLRRVAACLVMLAIQCWDMIVIEKRAEGRHRDWELRGSWVEEKSLCRSVPRHQE
jgi:hypothetical protein